MKKKFHEKQGVLAVTMLLAISAPTYCSAKDPFVSPAPSPEAFRYQEAASSIQLRGLFVTSAGSRAVLYHTEEDRGQVVSVNDDVIVDLEGLKHRYKVAGIGGRAVSLTGGDGKQYRIGVEERGYKK